MSALISVEDVSKTFPGVRALSGVRFELMPGEVHALMGENGAGKSTLMKILAGVYIKDSGTILYDGRPVDFTSPREAQAAGIGIIHQELQLMNHLTVAQNIFIGREPKRAFGLLLDEARLNSQATAILDHMSLTLDPRTVVGGLTVAKQQMVEIAKALSFNSRVLIMDEPTAALNNAEIAELFKMIRELKGRGVGIIYISHKIDELKQISDRVTVLRDGEYVGTVPTATTSIETIISMMVGRKLSDAPIRAAHPPRNEIALEVRNLNCGPLVRDVAFSLRRGEILGFAGLMGAGRTEVARAVFGADRAQSGEVVVLGRKVSIRTPAQAVARRHRLSVRGPQALRPRCRHGRLVQRRDGHALQVSVVPVLSAQRRNFADGGEIHQGPGHPHAFGDAGGAAAVGRQPAEDRRRQVARARLRHPVLRRADARHRRRREGRDL